MTTVDLEIAILEYIHAQNGKRVTSDEIRDRFNIKETTTGNFKTRKLIKSALREFGTTIGVPIGAERAGYFLIKTEQEVLEYVNNLNGRIGGIQERITLVMKAWKRSKDKIAERP
jgi:hypothetical protein